MLSDLDALTRPLVERLVTGSFQGLVAIGLVWLVGRSVPKLPAAALAALWWLVAFSLLMTFAPIPPLPIRVLPADAPSAAEQAGDAGREMSGRTTNSSAVNGPVAVPAPGPGDEITSLESTNVWLAGLAGAWMLGILWHAARLAISLHTLRGLVCRSAPGTNADATLVTQLAEVLQSSRVPEVRVSGEIDTPQLVGMLRPRVIMPLEATLTHDERAMVLCHELLHIRRRDLLLGWVPALAERLFFFHPLVRFAAREYVTAREAACDAKVVRTLGVSSIDYGRLLVRIGVEEVSSGVAAGTASTSISSLRRRLEMLEYSEQARVSRGLIGCVAAVLMATMIPFDLVARAPSSQKPAAIDAESNRMSPAAMLDLPAQPVPSPPVEGRRSQAAEDARGQSEAPPAGAQSPRETVSTQPTGVAASERQPLEQRVQELDAPVQKIADERAALEHLRRKQAITQEMIERKKREYLASQQEAQERMMRLQAVQRQLEQLAAVRKAIARQQQRPGTQRVAYSRGDLVMLTPASDGTRPPNSRVLAVAGDEIQVDRTGVLVNGTRVTELTPEFLAGLPEDTWKQSVPAGHYFVAAEQRTGTGAIRFWGLIPSSRIAGTP